MMMTTTTTTTMMMMTAVRTSSAHANFILERLWDLRSVRIAARDGRTRKRKRGRETRIVVRRAEVGCTRANSGKKSTRERREGYMHAGQKELQGCGRGWSGDRVVLHETISAGKSFVCATSDLISGNWGKSTD